MSHAVETEPVAIVPFDWDRYGKELVDVGLKRQQSLAAAYDAACRALIGPNDVQVSEGRTFKKKSAWRKLARHFNVSVEIVTVEHAWQDVLATGEHHFLATVTARAVAPWGQRYEEVGACCTDEATGRRVISVADAIATASTRASNRAISNVIAMGEVSAEEIGDRSPQGQGEPKAHVPGVPVMPFGRSKGKPLSEHTEQELLTVKAWCEKQAKPEKFAQLISQIDTELDSRREPGE